MIEKVGTLEAGGTISGDLVIEGDLTVEGSSTYTYDELVEGGIVIDTTGAEAFLVRKASDGGDVFTIDSSGEVIQINSHDGSTKGLKLGTTLVTSTASELNILDGATLSTAELNYVDGVTSAIQTQLDAKSPTASPTFTGTITIGSAEISETELEILDGATVTTAELNILDGVTSTATELNYLDITTLGTVEASKVVTADASGNINFNNGNMTNVDIDSGAIDGTNITVGTGKTLDVSSGTLTLGANQISGDKIDGGTISTFASTGIDDNASSNALTIDSSQNLAITSGTLEVYSNITTGAGNRDISLTPHGTGEVDVNATLDADALKINGTLVSATATELNVLDGITSSTAELNILDGVTSTASELNVLDGVTGFIDDDTMGTASATTIASAESIKAYVDAQDHDASDESVGGDLSGTVANATIVNDAVTYAKMQDVSATDRILGRDSSGAGIVEEISPSSLRTMINVEDGATADQTDAEIRTAVENATDSNVFTDADHSKLGGIEASADVTDATNVASAGAVMESDTTTASMSFVVDEDDMASNSATKLATQQSIKAYVDSVAQGLNVKTACAVATTANITLSGEQTIDGVTTSTSRVLVKDQTDASENGIYVSASGAWARATDLDAPQEVASSFVFITSGTNNADTGWVCTNEPESVTVGTDDITFSQFSDAGHITSGTGLTKTGNTLSVNASQTQITSVGTLGSLTVDNITIDGTEIDLSSGDLTIDVAGRIDLSADDNGEIRFFDGSSMFGQIKDDDDRLKIQGLIQDKDIMLVGNDGGSEVTALTLDMSDAGSAYFNNKVGIGTASPDGTLHISGDDMVAYFKATETYSAGVSGPKLLGQGNDEGGTVRNLGYILFTSQGSNQGEMRFAIRNSSGTVEDKMVIDDAGQVGIGTTTADSLVQLSHATEPDLRLHRASTSIGDGDSLGSIIWSGAGGESGVTASRVGAKIKAEASDTWEPDDEEKGTELQFFTQDDSDSDTLGSPRMVIAMDGNVGINEQSPETAVHITGTGGGVGSAVMVEDSTGSSNTKKFRMYVNNDKGYLDAPNDAFSSALDIATFDLSSGNVGIGGTPKTWYSTLQGGVLQLGGAGALATQKTFNSSGSMHIAYNMYIDAGGDYTYIGADEASTLQQTGGSFVFKTTSTAGDGSGTDTITFTDAMTIDSSGNVGIGTTSPSQELHVYGTDNNIGIMAEDNGGVQAYLRAGGSYATVGSKSNHDFAIQTNDSNVMYLTSGGNVGIGTTTPGSSHAKANKLVVGSGSACGIGLYAGANEGWYAFSRDNANNTDAYDGGMSYDGSRNLKFHTNAGATRLTIDGSGNATFAGKIALGGGSPNTTNQLMHIKGAAGTDKYAALIENTSSDGLGVYIHAASGSRSALRIRDYGVTTDLFHVAGNGETYMGGTATIDVAQATAGLIIDNDTAGKAGIHFKDGGASKGVVGLTGVITGDSSTDVGLFAESGSGIGFFVNGSGARSVDIASDGTITHENATFAKDAVRYGLNHTNNGIIDGSVGSGSATLYIGNQSITTSSDIRIKENVVDTEVDALSKISALRVVDFTWNDPSDKSFNNKNARGKWTGLIAQEVIDHVPYVVNAVRDEETLQPIVDSKNEDGSDLLWGMEYDKLVPVLIKAVQELSAKVEALENA